MAESTLQILGVYKPEISPRVYQEQRQVTGSDERTDAHFAKLVLIEALVSNVDGRLKMAELGQDVSVPGFPPHFQCAYDEALLSADGKLLIDRRQKCVHGTGELRFAFYLHFYDPRRPLHWSHGELECPPVEPVPDRLKILAPYRACT